MLPSVHLHKSYKYEKMLHQKTNQNPHKQLGRGDQLQFLVRK